MLTADLNSQIQAYKQFMAQQQDEDLVRVFERKNQPSMLGTKEFISRVKDRFFKKKIDREIPASKGLAFDLDKVVYWFRIIDASICAAKTDADTQLTVFESFVSEKQLLNF